MKICASKQNHFAVFFFKWRNPQAVQWCQPRLWVCATKIVFRAGSSQNFTVFICLLAPFPNAFGALFTEAAPSAPVCLEHVEHASSRPWNCICTGIHNFEWFSSEFLSVWVKESKFEIRIPKYVISKRQEILVGFWWFYISGRGDNIRCISVGISFHINTIIKH